MGLSLTSDGHDSLILHASFARSMLVIDGAVGNQRFEISADDLDPAFFLQIQQQLGVLVVNDPEGLSRAGSKISWGRRRPCRWIPICS